MAQVEEPVAEAVAGFDERPPRLWAAHAVDPQAAALLELPDRGLGALAERVVFGRERYAGAAQAAVEIRDRRAGGPRTEREALFYRYGCSS